VTQQATEACILVRFLMELMMGHMVQWAFRLGALDRGTYLHNDGAIKRILETFSTCIAQGLL
jgi:hypothetical protein